MPAEDLGALEVPIGAGRTALLPSFPAGRIEISLQPREGREENPIRTRLNDGPPKVYHMFDLEAGETVRLTLAIDS